MPVKQIIPTILLQLGPSIVQLSNKAEINSFPCSTILDRNNMDKQKCMLADIKWRMKQVDESKLDGGMLSSSRFLSLSKIDQNDFFAESDRRISTNRVGNMWRNALNVFYYLHIYVVSFLYAYWG